jgi:hypothetical protein
MKSQLAGALAGDLNKSVLMKDSRSERSSIFLLSSVCFFVGTVDNLLFAITQ